jgi:CHASE3 domain sensor protein
MNGKMPWQVKILAGVITLVLLYAAGTMVAVSYIAILMMNSGIMQRMEDKAKAQDDKRS